MRRRSPVYRTLLRHASVGATGGPAAGDHNMAIGLTGDPVPPTTRNGATMSMNS
jgi:hypothetical protein